ncbi:MAG: heparinase II/III family protein, partial [Alphaproteobacteria bacterium]|nr:heparinase II/III family protein [Alphaproteobacteria bacterium]
MPDDPTPIEVKSTGPAWGRGRRRLVNRWASFLGAVSPQKTPTRLTTLPMDPWPGDAATGAKLARNADSWAVFWDAPDAGPDDGALNAGSSTPSIHEFAWLRDLRAIGGHDARTCAHTLTRDWLDRFSRYSTAAPDGWRADVMGARLVAWFSQFELFFVPASDELRSDLLTALVRQHRHLGWTAAREVEGIARLTAIKGLLYRGLCLPDADAAADTALELLEQELAAQLHDDGGCLERNPIIQAALVRHLTDIRATLKSSDLNVPKFITGALRKAAPMVRMLRHADGKLAHFNGGYESDPSRIDLALAQANIRARTPTSAPGSGYERLSVGKYLVLVDTGAPARHNGHAGAGSFEFSFGRERLVVNCGAAQTTDPAWRRAGRGTSAHSTLSIGDTNSSGIEDSGETDARIAAVTSERDESVGAIWLAVTHDGYAKPYGKLHQRRLYLSASGEDLRGEDILSPAPNTINPGSDDGSGPIFTIRFHL